jgi:hypothetical protein
MTIFNREYEYFKNGLLKTITVKEHPDFDTVEIRFKQNLTEDNGKNIINSNSDNVWFFTSEEFQSFFTPIINDLKAKFENDNSNQTE